MDEPRGFLRRTRWVLHHWSQGAGMHVLLVALLARVALKPLLDTWNQPGVAWVLGVLLVPAALLAADVHRRWTFRFLAVLLLASAGMGAVGGRGPGSQVVTDVLAIALNLFLGYQVLRWVADQRRVGLSSVSAALCGYLLIAATWSSAYDLVDVLGEEPSVRGVENTWEEVQAPPPGLTSARVALRRRMELEYFSLVTLTTLGYGDLTPTTGWSRALASLEALLGQLYMVVLVAGLVSRHVAHVDEDPGP